MKKMKINKKQIWTFLPEIYFSLFFLYAVIDSAYRIVSKGGTDSGAWFMLAFSLVALFCMVKQFSWKSAVVGWLFSVVLSLSSLYMLLAVLSEYKEFPAGEGYGLLIVGVLIFGISAGMAIVMPWKYLKGIGGTKAEIA